MSYAVVNYRVRLERRDNSRRLTDEEAMGLLEDEIEGTEVYLDNDYVFELSVLSAAIEVQEGRA